MMADPSARERLTPCLTLSSYTNNVGGRLLESYSNTRLQADMCNNRGRAPHGENVDHLPRADAGA